MALTAFAPAAWGSTYVVTQELLPPDRPLFSAVMRALPVGLLMLALRPQLPRGRWWWRSCVLGLCNIGLFFPLLFLSAYGLPGGLAATIQAVNPLVVIALAWPMVGERATVHRMVGAAIGLVGVALLVQQTPEGITALGLVGAFGSVLISAVGFLLVKRWTPPVDMLTLVSWQLVAGGLVLLPLSLAWEGPPPALDRDAVLGFLWIGAIGTGVAQWCWFRGVRRMPAGSVAAIGLLTPAVGIGLGVAFAGETFGPSQAVGVALVLGGVVAGQRPPRPPRRGAPDANRGLAQKAI
ncbi:MAG TPA: EamA family transporter [Acidimicrobiales bacterium]